MDTFESYKFIKSILEPSSPKRIRTYKCNGFYVIA